MNLCIIINPISFYTGAQESLDEKVVLKPCETYELSTLKTPSDHNSVANSTEGLQAMEECIQVWIKQIEQVSQGSTPAGINSL